MSKKNIANLTITAGYRGQQLERGMSRAKKRTAAFQRQVNSLKSTMITMFGVGAGMGIMYSAAQTVKNFNQAQANLASVTGKTKEEISDLTKQAKQLGATTRYTANSITGLQVELAKLGFTSSEIKSSTEAVSNFAAATGADLPSAAKTAGVAVRAFGLQAIESEDAVSTMAVSTAKSALQFEDFETILSTVGPVAKAYGFTLSDTIALTGKLKDAGFDATKAATATRNILLNLADANGELAVALGRPVKSLSDLVDGLTELDKNGVSLAETLELTDKRSVAAFNQFLTGAESIEELKNEVEGVNDELQIMVDKQLDTIAGQIDLLTSAWQGFILSIEEGDGAIGKLVRGSLAVLTDALTELSNLDLIFVRSSRLTMEQAERSFDILTKMARASEGRQFQEIVKSMKDIPYKDLRGLKDVPLLGMAPSYKGSAFADMTTGLQSATQYATDFKEALREMGYGTEAASKLWDVYLNRRSEQHDTEIAKEKAKNERLLEEQKKANQSAIKELNKHSEKVKNIGFTGGADTAPDTSGLFSMGFDLGEEMFPEDNWITQYTEDLEAAKQAQKQFGETLISQLATGADSWEDYGQRVKRIVGDIITTQLASAISKVIVSAVDTSKAFGPAALAVLPALIGLGIGTIRTAFNQVPSFADGGIISGPTLGLMGEYPGASTNPEVVAPLNKLQKIIGGGSQWETANVRIGFDALEVAMKKIDNRNSSIYGI